MDLIYATVNGGLKEVIRVNDASGNGVAKLSIAGMVPAQGFTSKLTFNNRNQIISSVAATGIETQTVWDDSNHALSTLNLGTHRKTTAVYDDRGFQTDSYGPALESCFNGQLPTTACTNSVPHTTQQFDGTSAFKGLGVTYWSNTSLDGERQSAASHATGVGTSDGSVDANWGTATPRGVTGVSGWSARLNGGIQLDQVGSYALNVTANDGVRLWVDDALVIDKWQTTTTYTSTPIANDVANKWHRIRIEYRNFNGSNATLKLDFTPPGAAQQTVPGAKLRPNYGLVTRKTSVDNTAGSPTNTTNVDFIRPEYGQASVVVQDPTGLCNDNGSSQREIYAVPRLPPEKTLGYNFHSSLETYRFASGWGSLAALHKLKSGDVIDIWMDLRWRAGRTNGRQTMTIRIKYMD